MRVLLTGAAGFIGTRIRERLIDGGHDVVAVDAMLPAAHGEDAAPPDDVARVDVRDAAAVADAVAGVDVVCHQAAVVGAGVDAADAPSGSSSSASADGPPAWAKRMKRGSQASHGIQAAAHAVKSGDSHGGGSSVNLSESDR